MAKKGYTPEQIINKLREAELQQQQGATIAIVSKTIGVSSHTYYRWRKEYSDIELMYSFLLVPLLYCAEFEAKCDV